MQTPVADVRKWEVLHTYGKSYVQVVSWFTRGRVVLVDLPKRSQFDANRIIRFMYDTVVHKNLNQPAEQSSGMC